MKNLLTRTIKSWNPEDPRFWDQAGRRIANRNLCISIFCLLVSFPVWTFWSVIVVKLNDAGFHLDESQLFNLIAIPGLVGATMRIANSFVVSIFGGRNWIFLSTLFLLIPVFVAGYVVQHPDTSYETLILASMLCGLVGGNFSSSMANISYFYPAHLQGLALGLNAGFGNLGVSLLQFITPFVVGVAIFGLWGGSPHEIVKEGIVQHVWLQNAAYIWIVPIIIASLLAFFFMDNLKIAKESFKDQLKIFNKLDTYLTSWLYTTSFGSYIGFSAALLMVVKIQFPHVANALSFIWIGPFLGAAVRPLGGWLSDKLSGSSVTFWTFLVKIFAVISALYFMQDSHQSFFYFHLSFLVLFICTGIANGAIFRMIGVVFPVKEKSTVLGFAGAIGAYGAFLSPEVFKFSLKIFHTLSYAFCGAIIYYLIAMGITWFFYWRKKGRHHLMV